ARLSEHAREQGLDLLVDRVIARDRDPLATERGHLRRGLADGARVRARRDGATGDVDGGARLAEAERDALAHAAARAGDERDLPRERLRVAHSVLVSDSTSSRMRPARMVVVELTMMCCVATCTSRKRRCSGCLA